MDLTPIRGVVARDDLVGRIHQEVHRVVTERRASINAAFPNMNSGLTGYNLKHVLGEDSLFRLSYLLAGSEGTLALTKSITVRVVPLSRAPGACRSALCRLQCGARRRSTPVGRRTGRH